MAYCSDDEEVLRLKTDHITMLCAQLKAQGAERDQLNCTVRNLGVSITELEAQIEDYKKEKEQYIRNTIDLEHSVANLEEYIYQQKNCNEILSANFKQMRGIVANLEKQGKRKKDQQELAEVELRRQIEVLYATIEEQKLTKETRESYDAMLDDAEVEAGRWEREYKAMQQEMEGWKTLAQHVQAEKDAIVAFCKEVVNGR